VVVFDPSTQQYINVPDPTRVRIPFLRQEIGAGDAVAAATGAMGIQSCPPCQKRQEWLNRHLRLSPWGT